MKLKPFDCFIRLNCCIKYLLCKDIKRTRSGLKEEKASTLIFLVKVYIEIFCQVHTQYACLFLHSHVLLAIDLIVSVT